MKSTGYGAVPYQPTETFIPVDEVFFGVNQFKVMDDPFDLTETARTEKFVNINFYKTVMDTSRAY